MKYATIVCLKSALIACLMACLWASIAHAQITNKDIRTKIQCKPEFKYTPEYTPEEYCAAIYQAEGTKSKHPYGILKRYKHTTPKQACINTVKHKYRDWLKSGQGEPFLAYLAGKYAPVGAKNDPRGLNKHWQKNVKYFLDRIKK